MRRPFTIVGQIVSWKSVKNGLIITVRERRTSALSHSNYEHLAIWGPKAKAIEAKLEKRARFEFRGSLDRVRRNGRTYWNHTVQQWIRLPNNQPNYRQPREEISEDWFVPGVRQRDSRAQRLEEGFQA